jgi:hypothetical protein
MAALKPASHEGACEIRCRSLLDEVRGLGSVRDAEGHVPLDQLSARALHLPPRPRRRRPRVRRTGSPALRAALKPIDHVGDCGRKLSRSGS